MTKVRASHPALEKPRQPGRIRAFVLAVVVHVAFFALIVVGVSWQTRPTAPVVAELWDKLPPARSRPPEPKPAPPEPEPPKPEPPKPEPPRPEPPPKVEPKPEVKPQPPKPDPEIERKLEREKREKAKREQLEREKEERRKLEEKKKREQEEAAAKRKREQEEAARKKREEERRREEEERLRREAEQARLAAIAARQAEVDRYINLIRAKIRGRANVPDTVPTGTEAEFRIRILPGGEVLNITLTRRSGHPAYDAAIERAIRSAQPLPVPPANSELFPQFRDLTLHMKHER